MGAHHSNVHEAKLLAGIAYLVMQNLGINKPSRWGVRGNQGMRQN
jgi:hypothetical protein